MVRQRLWCLGLVIPGLLAARTLAVLAQEQACVTPPLGMTGWWPGNGNANDVLFANHGTIDNTVSFGEGRVGQAFNFGATSTGVKVTASPRTNVGAGTGMTIEAWINPTNASPGEPLFEWNNGTTFGVHLWIHEATGELYGNFMDIGGVAHFIKSPPGVITPGVYQHIALTYDRNTGVASLYRNGQVVATETVGNFYPQTTFDLYFGYRPGLGAGLRYLGTMDEISIYRRALPASEILRVYNAGAAGKCLPGATRPLTGTNPLPGAGAVGVGTTGTTRPASVVGTTGTGTVGAPTIVAPIVTPTPVPQPTPTPVPMTTRPNPAGPVAVLDFTVAPGLDPALGHRVSDALATALQRAGMDVRTRQQIAEAVPAAVRPNLPAAHPRYVTAADIEAMQRQQAQSVNAGSLIIGKVSGLQERKGQSAQLTVDVRQLEAATGTYMDGITVTETSPPHNGTVPDQTLWDGVLRRAVASIVRVLRPAAPYKAPG